MALVYSLLPLKLCTRLTKFQVPCFPYFVITLSLPLSLFQCVALPFLSHFQCSEIECTEDLLTTLQESWSYSQSLWSLIHSAFAPTESPTDYFVGTAYICLSHRTTVSVQGVKSRKKGREREEREKQRDGRDRK